jgi:hypothetical protein
MKLIVIILLFMGTVVSVSAQQNISIVARVNRYDTELHNEKIAFAETRLTGPVQSLVLGASEWQVSLAEHKDEKGDILLTATFACAEGAIENASVSLSFVLTDWSLENYLLMPAAVYNGNRYPAITMGYMPFWSEFKHLGVDKPILLSNQPRLNYSNGPSEIQLRSGSMSIPSLGYQNPSTKMGTWFLFQQGNEQGDYGVTFTENKSRNKAVFSLTSPVVREKTQYFIANNNAPSEDVPATYRAGDRVVFNVKLVQFDAENRQELYNKWADYRDEYASGKPKTKELPLSAASKIIEEKFNRQNWRNYGYYAVGTTDNMWQDWQIGWTGGMITTLPLLINGNELTKQRVIKNFDWLFENGVAPTGYYYDVLYKNKPYGAFVNKPLGDSLLLTRKNADATYYIYKQFMAMRKLGIPVKQKWEKGNEGALQAQIKTWAEYGQLGHFVNQETGRLVIGNTSSAGLFPASLCAAFAYTGKRDYVKIAEEIGEYFYIEFIQKGLTCGGPGDAMQSFDSESSYALLVSMVDLYETTNNKKWLSRAEEMAKQFSTWVVGYDYRFPQGSTYEKLGIRTTGGVYANTQNQHAAPGICTHSGEALFKLYRFTENPFYLNLIADLDHTLPQFLSRPEKQIECLDNGWVSERINMTDWLEGIGETFCGSTWAETALLLSATELPAVYINTENGEITELDHVQAKVVKNNPRQLWVEISNPTSKEAELKIVAENSAERMGGLGYNANMAWQKINLPAGKSEILKINKKERGNQP